MLAREGGQGRGFWRWGEERGLGIERKSMGRRKGGYLSIFAATLEAGQEGLDFRRVG